ncbi:MAG: helix-turn-helix transcriptional regulator [Clostridia bacterium]|nr:helix-turn-helix transcriptional regulator [Clostridia bacterium]
MDERKLRQLFFTEISKAQKRREERNAAESRKTEDIHTVVPSQGFEKQDALWFARELGQNIGEMRKACGLTQIQLGEQSHLGRVRIGRIERGDVELTVRELEAISKALGCTPMRLWPGEAQLDRLSACVEDLREALSQVSGWFDAMDHTEK